MGHNFQEMQQKCNVTISRYVWLYILHTQGMVLGCAMKYRHCAHSITTNACVSDTNYTLCDHEMSLQVDRQLLCIDERHVHILYSQLYNRKFSITHAWIYTQTHRPNTVTLTAHARPGLIIICLHMHVDVATCTCILQMYMYMLYMHSPVSVLMARKQ